MSDSDGLYLGPCASAGDDWTDAQIARFAAEWRRQANSRHVRLLTPLPLRTRARLAATRRVDKAAIWLVRRGRHQAAVRLWKTCGMWRR